MNIFDIVILIALAVFTVLGAKRGLVMTLCSLVACVIALVGAPVIADAISPAVAAVFQPTLETTVLTAIENSTVAGEQVTVAVPDALAGNALTEHLLTSQVYQHFAETVTSGVEQSVYEVAAGISAALANTIAWFVVYIIAFVLILILGHLIARVLNLAAKLPGLHFLNQALGGVCGFLKGALYVAVIASLAVNFGLIAPEYPENSVLLALFSSFTTISL